MVGSDVGVGVLKYREYAQGYKRQIRRCALVILGLYIRKCTVYIVRPSIAR